jgi:hypothetical protein
MPAVAARHLHRAVEMTEDRERQTWIRDFLGTKTFIWVLCVLLIVTAVGVPLFFHHVATRWSQMMSDFAALWSVTDVLQAHVLAEDKWPENWEALREALDEREPHVDNYGVQVRSRVDVNFELDLNSPMQGKGWYVRVKEGRLGGEVDRANRRIRNMLEEIQCERKSGNGSPRISSGKQDDEQGGDPYGDEGSEPQVLEGKGV